MGLTVVTELTWSMVDYACRYIAQHIDCAVIKSVFGPKRGGLIPAVRISHLLDLQLLTWHKYIKRDTLVVDDIVDTGTLMMSLLSKWPAGMTASLVYNPKSNFKPDVWAFEKGTEWVVYPWEVP